MRAFPILFFILFGLCTLKGQSINGVPIVAMDAEFIEIIVSYNPYEANPDIEIEVGTALDTYKDAGGKPVVVTNRREEPQNFSNAMDALNFWSDFYDLQYVYNIVRSESTQTEVHYLMKKKI